MPSLDTFYSFLPRWVQRTLTAVGIITICGGLFITTTSALGFTYSTPGTKIESLRVDMNARFAAVQSEVDSLKTDHDLLQSLARVECLRNRSNAELAGIKCTRLGIR